MPLKIVLASNNLGKVREMQAIWATSTLELVPQSDFAVPSVNETGLTFRDNALIKARHAAKYTGLPSIADDSGLEVDILRGAPGVFSSRYAGVSANDAENNAKLLRELDGVPHEKRTARFCCAIVYVRSEEDTKPIISEGIWEGIILSAPVGTGGFGYDPLFFVPEKGCSSAELSVEIKNQLSHRGKALRAFITQFS